MPADDYTHIRVRKSTLARLREYGAHLADRALVGLPGGLDPNPEQINPRGVGVSMDAVIVKLLSRVLAKRARARKSAAKRGQARPK